MTKLYLKKQQAIATDLGILVPAAFLSKSITEDIISFPTTFASGRVSFNTHFTDRISGMNLKRNEEQLYYEHIVVELESGQDEKYMIAQAFIKGFLKSLENLESTLQALHYSVYTCFLPVGLYKKGRNKPPLCIPMLREEDFDFYSKLELDFADDEFKQQFIQDLIFLIDPRISKKLATEIRRVVKDYGGKPRKNVMWFDLEALFRSPIMERGIKVLKSSYKERVIEDFLQEEREKLSQEEPELDESASTISDEAADSKYEPELMSLNLDHINSWTRNLDNINSWTRTVALEDAITSSQEEEES